MQATAIAHFANVHRDRKKHRDPFEAADFMPGLQEEDDPEEIQAVLQGKLDTFFVGLAAAARSAERRKGAPTPTIQRRRRRVKEETRGS